MVRTPQLNGMKRFFACIVALAALTASDRVSAVGLLDATQAPEAAVILETDREPREGWLLAQRAPRKQAQMRRAQKRFQKQRPRKRLQKQRARKRALIRRSQKHARKQYLQKKRAQKRFQKQRPRKRLQKQRARKRALKRRSQKHARKQYLQKKRAQKRLQMKRAQKRLQKQRARKRAPIQTKRKAQRARPKAKQEGRAKPAQRPRGQARKRAPQKAAKKAQKRAQEAAQRARMKAKRKAQRARAKATQRARAQGAQRARGEAQRRARKAAQRARSQALKRAQRARERADVMQKPAVPPFSQVPGAAPGQQPLPPAGPPAITGQPPPAPSPPVVVVVEEGGAKGGEWDPQAVIEVIRSIAEIFETPELVPPPEFEPPGGYDPWDPLPERIVREVPQPRKPQQRVSEPKERTVGREQPSPAQAPPKPPTSEAQVIVSQEEPDDEPTSAEFLEPTKKSPSAETQASLPSEPQGPSIYGEVVYGPLEETGIIDDVITRAVHEAKQVGAAVASLPETAPRAIKSVVVKTVEVVPAAVSGAVDAGKKAWGRLKKWSTWKQAILHPIDTVSGMGRKVVEGVVESVKSGGKRIAAGLDPKESNVLKRVGNVLLGQAILTNTAVDVVQGKALVTGLVKQGGKVALAVGEAAVETVTKKGKKVAKRATGKAAKAVEEVAETAGGRAARPTTPNRVPPQVRDPGSPYFTRIDPSHPGRPAPAYSVDTKLFTSGKTTKRKGIRNAPQFWKVWSEKPNPALSEANKERIAKKLSPKVDEVWIKVFKEHAPYERQILVHHHVDHGRYAIPLPREVHANRPGFGIWHAPEFQKKPVQRRFQKRRARKRAPR